MVFSTLGGTLNTFVDSLFVSNLVGAAGLTAVNMCLPIYLIMCTVGALIGCGAAVLSTRETVRENMGEAEARYNDSIKLCLISGAVITVAGLLLMNPLSVFLAQGSEILTKYIYIYAFYTFLSTIPNCLLFVAVQYLQLEGKLREITNFMAIMIGLDIFLDFVFMVPLGMGLRGAALASLFSVAMACVYGFFKLQTGVSNYHFKKSKLTWNNTKEISIAGSAFASGNCYDVIKTFVINAYVLAFWGTGAAAVLAILNSISEISLSITTGVPNAAGPLVGVFNTAKENSSLKLLMNVQIKAGLLFSVATAAVFILANGFIAKIFACDQNLLLPLLCFSLFVILDMLASIYSNYVNKCNYALLANVIVFIRRLFSPLLGLLLMHVLSIYLWSFYVIMGVLTIGLILICVKIFLKKSQNDRYPLEGLLLLDNHLDKENKVLDFSVDATDEKICEASEQITEFCMENEMPMKDAMKLQLAIEEVLTVYAAKIENLASIDLRAYALIGIIGIRVRVSGARYNPFEIDDEDDDFLMGIRIIDKLSDAVTYTYTLGLNNINILFDIE